MRWILMGFLVLFLCGCAARWEHSSKRRGEFFPDDRACQSLSGGASAGIEPGQERISYESCMWEKGWRKKQTFWFFNPASR